MSYQLYCQFCLAPETRPGSDQTPDPSYTCERCERAYEAGRRDEANAQAGKRAAARMWNNDTVPTCAEAADASAQDAALLEAGGEALPSVVHEALAGVPTMSRCPHDNCPEQGCLNGATIANQILEQQGQRCRHVEWTTPRRDRLDLFTPAERAIWDAAQAVECAGCDVRLTSALNLLHAARSKVADFVDRVPTAPYGHISKADECQAESEDFPPFGVDPEDSAALLKLRSAIDDHLPAFEPESEAGDYEGVVRIAGQELEKLSFAFDELTAKLADARAELRARDPGDALERLAMQIAERIATGEGK